MEKMTMESFKHYASIIDVSLTKAQWNMLEALEDGDNAYISGDRQCGSSYVLAFWISCRFIFGNIRCRIMGDYIQNRFLLEKVRNFSNLFENTDPTKRHSSLDNLVGVFNDGDRCYDIAIYDNTSGVLDKDIKSVIVATGGFKPKFRGNPDFGSFLSARLHWYDNPRYKNVVWRKGDVSLALDMDRSSDNACDALFEAGFLPYHPDIDSIAKIVGGGDYARVYI